jgi:hypothetical protein
MCLSLPKKLPKLPLLLLMIAWITIEARKTDAVNGVKYETQRNDDGNIDGVDNYGHTFIFSQSFSSPPIMVAKQNTHYVADGAWVPGFGTHTATQHITGSEEDQNIYLNFLDIYSWRS